MTCFLHTLFEEQEKLNPDGVAVRFNTSEITYYELNRQSNQLANYLSANGVKNGNIIKICIERSIQMIIGILGILKCGAAYHPVDPKIPEERLAFLMGDCNCPVFVTNQKVLEKITRVTPEQKVVSLDTDWETISNYSPVGPVLNIQDSNIAVVLYTSGSTGYPKGVLLSHKSLVNRLVWDREAYKHNSNDIVLQHASYNFDFSILEIFMALANGGKLILARPDFHYESFYLIKLIQQEKITKIGSVPSLLKAYIKFPGFENCTSLKQVFLGGEILDYDLQNAFFQKSSAELINIYGPTETSISVLHWICNRNSKDRLIPIGFPVANMRIYLLDEERRHVPDGEVGEIYISGIGVAHGYLNRTELTTHKFLADAFTTDKEVRMYKTGDFGRKLPDGAIQYTGRKDRQIKIHGLRVELYEIEHHLSNHKSISECVVTGIRNADREIKLIAYIKPAFNEKVDIDDIKNYLHSKLPDYMVPGLYIRIRSGY